MPKFEVTIIQMISNELRDQIYVVNHPSNNDRVCFNPNINPLLINSYLHSHYHTQSMSRENPIEGQTDLSPRGEMPLGAMNP